MEFFTSSRFQRFLALDRLPLLLSVSLVVCLNLSTKAEQPDGTSPKITERQAFNASVIDNKFVLTDWKITQPNAQELYTIERSSDGIRFETAGYVHGEYSNAPEINYSFIDENPQNGISYYRIKTTHSNKQVSYSPVASVQLSKLQFQVYPNPAQRNESVNMTIQNTRVNDVVLQLFDMSGKRVLNKTVQLNDGGNLLQLPLSGISAGMYSLTISSETFFEKHMLSVQ